MVWVSPQIRDAGLHCAILLCTNPALVPARCLSILWSCRRRSCRACFFRATLTANWSATLVDCASCRCAELSGWNAEVGPPGSRPTAAETQSTGRGSQPTPADSGNADLALHLWALSALGQPATPMHFGVARPRQQRCDCRHGQQRPRYPSLSLSPSHFRSSAVPGYNHLDTKETPAPNPAAMSSLS